MYKNILVAVDMGHEETNLRLVAKAKVLLDPNGKITLLHVLDEAPSYARTYMTPETIKNNMKAVRGKLEALATLSGGGLTTVVKFGRPSPVILDTVTEVGADLVMLASHRPNVTDYLLGSTASRVVRHAKCSVLVSR